MSSHGATCAISNLPINPGDAVRVMMLTHSPHPHTFGGSIGAHDNWIPRAFPLRAELGEYLNADTFEAGDPTGIGRALWVDGLHYDCACPAELSDDFDELWQDLYQHGVSVVREGRTTEEMERDLNRPRSEAWIKMFAGPPLPVSIAYIREDIWTAMLGEPVTWDNGWPGPVTFDQIHAEVVRYYAVVQAVIAERQANLEARIVRWGPGSNLAEAVAEEKRADAEYAANMDPKRLAFFAKLREKMIAQAAADDVDFDRVLTPEEIACNRIEAARRGCTWADMAMDIEARFEAPVKAAGDLHKSAGHVTKVVGAYLGSSRSGEGETFVIRPAHHFELWASRGLTGEAAAPWLRLFAEYIHVDQLMYASRRMWAPSNHGRDDGPIYSKLLRLFADTYDADTTRSDLRYLQDEETDTDD